ncbi:MAG: A/G-specific adenine glycosylase, partial [Anaerolineales bacterium]|nr:A/G-specific adenine glycosylase [Anaerolineales bacterium]
MIPLSRALLTWYAANGRDLPWRHTRDPYAIWVAETMLQQTRVETVIPYYQRWMRRFPSVQAVASAGEQEVLRRWEGLGYYGRARSLRRAAQQVVAEHAGQLPRTRAELRALPGIGAYTASAIAAIAFGAQELALDGNLRRVLCRLLDFPQDPRSPEGERFLRQQALPWIPDGRGGDLNQALMDLGAGICLPRRPDCAHCPVSKSCAAHERGTQALRPMRPERKPIPKRIAAAGVVQRGRAVMIARRPPGGLLGGLWEFPGGKPEAGESIDQTLRRELREELAIEVEVVDSLGSFDHAYTHFRVTVYAFECRLRRGEPRLLEHTDLRWVRPEALGRYPMGKIDRAIARRWRS